MKLLLTALFCGAALALPNGRVLRPEGTGGQLEPETSQSTKPDTPPCQPTPQTPILTSQEPSDPTARPPPSTSSPSAELRDPHPRTESSEDLRLSPTSGHGRLLCSLTMHGSVE